MDQINNNIPLKLKDNANKQLLLDMGFIQKDGFYELNRRVDTLYGKGWWWSSISIDCNNNNLITANENSFNILFDLIQIGLVEKMTPEQAQQTKNNIDSLIRKIKHEK